MLHKRNVISIAVGTVFFLTFGATSVSAADTAKEGDHQHRSGQAEGHDDMKSDDHHENHCKHMMSEVDLDKDGKISRREFMSHHGAKFDKKDINKDGFLDEAEMSKMMKHMHEHAHEHEGNHAHGDTKNSTDK